MQHVSGTSTFDVYTIRYIRCQVPASMLGVYLVCDVICCAKV